MKMFCRFEKECYLCTRYPENNLFTLKKLIPIEDRAISCEACRFFYARMFCREPQKYILDDTRSIHLMRSEAISEGVRSHL